MLTSHIAPNQIQVKSEAESGAKLEKV